MDSGNFFVFYLLFNHISAQNSVIVFILCFFCCLCMYLKDVSIHNQWEIIKMKQNVRH